MELPGLVPDLPVLGPGTVGLEHRARDEKTLTCSDSAPHGVQRAGVGVELPQGPRPKGISFRVWDRARPGSLLDLSCPAAGEQRMNPSSPSVSPLPADAAAGWDLRFDQAVVFIEDAIQVGRASSCWLGLGLSLGPRGLSDGCPDGPFTLCHPGAKAGVGRPCGPWTRDGLTFGHGLFESLLEQVGARRPSEPPAIRFVDLPPSIVCCPGPGR